MKLYEDGVNPKYTRLDDDVSFQLLRTNPILTTNTKIMYDGENIYMESYPATPLLSTRTYKGYKINCNDLFSSDIKNFLTDTGTAAYTVGQDMDNTIIGTSFDNQFETMYWSGAESISSYTYPQELGFIAPIYLRKKLPEYFVIFRMDTPANTNIIKNDKTFDFKSDVFKQAKIIKSFNLRENTNLGKYIRNYTGQYNFRYDSSLYVNFSANEIYYYGIDRNTGVMTQKVENINEQMLDNDYTIMRTDEWITTGFERNDLIFPYIMNIEFLFDDDETDEYKFARYFGLYCNGIDLQEMNITGVSSSGNLFMDWSDTDIYNIDTNKGYIYYVKDKYDNLYSFDDDFRIDRKIDSDDFIGYENSKVSVYAERMTGMSAASMILKIDSGSDGRNYTDLYVTIKDETGNILRKYESTSELAAGTYKAVNRFSGRGTTSEIATALAAIINKYPPNDWITAYSAGGVVVIESRVTGSRYDGKVTFDVSDNISMMMDSFGGGTDLNGCIFKINSEDKDIFAISDDRYIKSIKNKNDSKVTSIRPYVDSRGIDEDYYVISTDLYGSLIRVSRNNYIEILDKFYARLGVLSFFPVRDFDFDTVHSAYGDCTPMKNELSEINNELGSSISYNRFYSSNGQEIDNEYEYYYENIIPELCTENKTVPYISKWGYMDESKDSCENPYRLNGSKIFGTCNFSANTFMHDGDLQEYTHSMPYYILYDTTDKDIDEYQYIINDIVDTSIDHKNVNKWIEAFSDMETDYFDKIFGDSSNNKRYRKKYSRFLGGSSTMAASTLFRGVKFEIVEYTDSKQIKNGKYNGYKFSFIYIPYKSSDKDDFDDTVYFVKNDTFGFVVGMVFFAIPEMKVDEDDDESLDLPFGKGQVYAGSLGYMVYGFSDEDNEN